MAHDGSVTLSTALDNSGIQKDINNLKKEIKKSTEDIEKAESAKLPLVDQAKELNQQLDAAKKKLDDLEKKNKDAGILSDDEMKEKTSEYKKHLDEMSKANQQMENAVVKREEAEHNADSIKEDLESAKRKLRELNDEKQKYTQMQSGDAYIDPQEFVNTYTKQDALSKEIKTQQAEVEKLKQKWTKACEQVDKYDEKITAASQRAKDAAAAADQLKPTINATNEYREQEAEIARIESKLDSVNAKIDGYDAKIKKANESIAANTEEAGKLSAKLTSGSAKMSAAVRKVDESANRLRTRLGALASGALVFSVISAGLRQIQQYMNQTLNANSQYTAQLAKLKGALLTAFQPIYDFVLPGVLAVLRVLTLIAQMVAGILSKLTGRTAAQSAESAKNLYEEANAIGEVGDAAKEARKELAAFDEINQLGNSDSGAGSVSTGTVTPDFSFTSDGEINSIADAVIAIGAGLGAWKITKTVLEWFNLLTGGKFSNIGKVAAGVGMIASGLVLCVENIDAILSGEYANTSGESALKTALSGLLIGLGLTATGLGSWVIAPAVAITFVVTDIAVNWETYKNAWKKRLDAIASLFSGDTDGFWDGVTQAYYETMQADSWDTKISQWLTDLFFGEGAWEKAMEAIESGITFKDAMPLWIVDVVEWFSDACQAIGGFFSGLWKDIVEIWNNCAGWFHANVIQPVVGFFTGLWDGISTAASGSWASIVGFFSPAFEWFSTLFGSIWQTISDVFYNIGVVASGCWEIIKAVWDTVATWFDANVIQPVSGFFSRLWSSVSAWAINTWKGICSAFSGLAAWFDKNVIQPVAGFFKGLWEDISSWAIGMWEDICAVFSNVVSFFKGILNGVIGALNSALSWIFGGINEIISSLKDINIGGYGPLSGLTTISVPQIPYLAQGAVLPANKPFLAMVGDQKNGTNVEAPLETIKQALAEVMAVQGSGDITINFTGDLAQLARVLKPVIDREGRRVGGSLAKGAYTY